MNPVLILTHNCLELTKKCVESVKQQDIETVVYLFDNGSTDGTIEWATNEDLLFFKQDRNRGVSFGWNVGLKFLFSAPPPFDHCLVMNNDTILPPWFYRSLLDYAVPFVTGVSVGSMEEIAPPSPRKELAPCPDFSAFMIRREAWETVGEFDESLVHYCGDLDYHIRAHRKGVRLWNAGVSFFHRRSSTINGAEPKDRRNIQLQADADRDIFRQKWGFEALSGAGYNSLFDEGYFGCEVNSDNKS